MRSRVLAAAWLVLAAFPAAASAARADVSHVVQKGHTVEAIAHRYRVTVKSILDANHLKDASHLKPGQTLIIPGVKEPHGTTGAALEQGPSPRGEKDRNFVHAVRFGEQFRIPVKEAHGHLPEASLKAFERLMRQGDSTHPPDPRLVALIAAVSRHFEGRTIEVVSGYRAYTPTQYTSHSNHNYGKALDFRIQGVPNESLRDFCLTLRNAGCGYYPNSTFVHVDTRESKAYWVDRSRPGEPPLYDHPGSPADEGASDVPDDRPAQTSNLGGTTPGSIETLPPLPPGEPAN